MKKLDFFNKQRITVEDMNNMQQWNTEGITNQYGAVCGKGVVRGNDKKVLGYHNLSVSPYIEQILNPLDLVFTANGTMFDIRVPGSVLFNSAFFVIDAHGRLIKINQPVVYDSTVSADMTRSSGNIEIPLPSTSNEYFYVWIKYKAVVDTTVTKTDKDGGVHQYKEIGGYEITVTSSSTDVTWDIMVPAGTDDWIFLGKIFRDNTTSIQTYFYDEVTYAGVESSSVNIKIDSTKIPTTYTDGDIKSLSDHINSVGSGTISKNNPHGLHPDNMAQVDTDNIADDSISHSKMQNDSVSNFKIMDQSITSNKVILGLNLLPAGCIIPYASATLPTDSKGFGGQSWLLCDGSTHSSILYPQLAAILENTYGVVATNFFKLPDYRGYFLRGAGVNIDGTSGEIVGQKQTDMVGPHNRTINYGNAGISSEPIVNGDPDNNVYLGTKETNNNLGTETRPKNISVLYIISTGR